MDQHPTVFARGSDPPYPPMPSRAGPIAKIAIATGPARDDQTSRAYRGQRRTPTPRPGGRNRANRVRNGPACRDGTGRAYPGRADPAGRIRRSGYVALSFFSGERVKLGGRLRVPYVVS